MPSDQILDQAEPRDAILEHAAQRAASTATTQKEQEAQAVEAVRQEIGPHVYERAKEVLPTFEFTISEFKPFVQQARALVQQTTSKAVATQLDHWLRPMETICESVPLSLRRGIKAYDTLSFASIAMPDGRTIDVNKRRDVIGSIRMLLQIYDGQLSFLRSQKQQLRSFMREHNGARESTGGTQ